MDFGLYFLDFVRYIYVLLCFVYWFLNFVYCFVLGDYVGFFLGDYVYVFMLDFGRLCWILGFERLCWILDFWSYGCVWAHSRPILSLSYYPFLKSVRVFCIRLGIFWIGFSKSYCNHPLIPKFPTVVLGIFNFLPYLSCCSSLWSPSYRRNCSSIFAVETGGTCWIWVAFVD